MNSASTKMSENRGYSRGDSKGVIFVVDAKTEDEARAIMETLPLEHLTDDQYIPFGPLLLLRALMGPGGSDPLAIALLRNEIP